MGWLADDLSKESMPEIRGAVSNWESFPDSLVPLVWLVLIALYAEFNVCSSFPTFSAGQLFIMVLFVTIICFKVKYHKHLEDLYTVI